MGHLREWIDHDPYRVTAVGEGKVHNKVHGDCLPWGVGSVELEGLEEFGVRVPGGLFPLAFETASDVTPDGVLEAGPPEVARDELHGFIHGHVARDSGVMLRLEDVLLQG